MCIQKYVDTHPTNKRPSHFFKSSHEKYMGMWHSFLFAISVILSSHIIVTKIPSSMSGTHLSSVSRDVTNAFVFGPRAEVWEAGGPRPTPSVRTTIAEFNSQHFNWKETVCRKTWAMFYCQLKQPLPTYST